MTSVFTKIGSELGELTADQCKKMVSTASALSKRVRKTSKIVESQLQNELEALLTNGGASCVNICIHKFHAML